MSEPEARRPKVLLVTRNFPPQRGGMERLNGQLAVQLSRWADVQVVAPQGAAAFMPDGAVAHEAPLTPLSRFLWRGLLLSMKAARKWRPDIVLAGSGLTAPLVWMAARVAGAHSVAYVHGLDIVVPHLGYRLFWRPFLRRMDCIIANSHPTAELAAEAGVSQKRISIVHPGVELPAVNVDDEAVKAFRSDHSLGDRTMLLSVGRLAKRKGLKEFVRDVLPRIVAQHPDAMFVVIGDAPTTSLYAEAQTPQSIQAAADEAGVGANLKFLGAVSDAVLAAAYRAADVYVFPVLSIPGDPEGFGMVALEAAAHGLPTVAYATGGVPDAVSEGVSGYLVPAGEPAGFADAINRLLASRPNAAMRSGTAGFARNFRWERFGERIVERLNACLRAQ